MAGSCLGSVHRLRRISALSVPSPGDALSSVLRQAQSWCAHIARHPRRRHVARIPTDGLPYLIINGLLVLGIFGFLLDEPEFESCIMIPVPILMVWGIVFWKRMRGYFNQWGQVWSNLTDHTVETLTGIRVVKAFAQEKREMATFARHNHRVRGGRRQDGDQQRRFLCYDYVFSRGSAC